MKREVNMYDSETALYRQKWYYRNLVIIELQKPELFLRKGVLKICSKFTGEYSCRRVISIMLQSNYIEIALRHGCSPVNLLHIFLFLGTPLVDCLWNYCYLHYTIYHFKL